MINSGFLGFGDVIQFAPANMFFWDGYWVQFGPVIVLTFLGYLACCIVPVILFSSVLISGLLVRS